MPGLDRYPSMTGWNVVVTPVIRPYDRCHDAWASGLGDWGECEADDDDDFDEPGAWRDSMALDDCDA